MKYESAVSVPELVKLDPYTNVYMLDEEEYL